MNVLNHPMMEAHRLACVDLVELMNTDWYDAPQLDRLIGAINPWDTQRVNEALQALYRPRFANHFRELTGRKGTQDCPEDYLQGFRAIAMAQMFPINLFEREPRRPNAELQTSEAAPGLNRGPIQTTVQSIPDVHAARPVAGPGRGST